MAEFPRDPMVEQLQRKAYQLRDKLRLLPSVAWAKDATNRKRAKYAAQLRSIENQLLKLRQIGLFPLNRRREDEIA
jgi:hypothetical protein